MSDLGVTAFWQAVDDGRITFASADRSGEADKTGTGLAVGESAVGASRDAQPIVQSTTTQNQGE